METSRSSIFVGLLLLSFPPPTPQSVPPCHPGLLIFLNSRPLVILWQTYEGGSSSRGFPNYFLKKAHFPLLLLRDLALTPVSQ